MATNRFICEICNKGFKREQNLQLHRRGHNLPWKLKQRSNKDQIKKKVYICPEKTCVHHDPARALGDLTGVKKHFSRKHGEKKWKCEKCSKKYAVQSDWKAHSKTCGTREYKCDCGTLFSRKDSFITHRAFCDALAEESARITTVGSNLMNPNPNFSHGFTNSAGISHFQPNFASTLAGNTLLGDHNPHQKPRLSLWLDHQSNPHDYNPNIFIPTSSSGLNFPEMIQMTSNNIFGGNMNPTADTIAPLYSDNQNHQSNSKYSSSSAPPLMSATALLQKAAQMGSTKSNTNFFNMMNNSSNSSPSSSSTNTLSFSNNPLGQTRSSTELHRVFAPENPTTKGADEMMNFGSSRINNVDQSMMIQSSNGQITNSMNLHGVENSLTRDFLGMGGGGGGAAMPFSPQELARFASMSSAMGMSHFPSNH
ncbi:hypothetical protein BUALT_Bualt11G0111300 [Buddleja alternifolia]|uniref:C2H2-type domain-containing protein n=1 Tax=Buddleja alternifolia TaxID=168488 RepID=A0AAV6WTB9_9LAMI|nr:hypothetical protein BUALT_Bualt11G0111300 [Buddleja alternifolia]